MRRLVTAEAGVILFTVLPGAHLLCGCAGDSQPPPSRSPTFHEDVQPILQRSCLGCHAPGGLAPLELVTYDDVKPLAELVATRVEERVMPPWGALETEDCRPPHAWKEDLRLSDEQIATIRQWVNAGAPEGPRVEAPPPVPLGDELRGADVTVEPQALYTPTGTADILRCFVVDPQLAKDEFLNGTNFIAGNRRVVHHANAWLVPEDAVAMKPSEYDCFGGPEVDGAELLAAWTPGAVPNEYPPDVGQRLPAGSKIVLQVHYHPHEEAPEPDLTRFQMRFTDAPPKLLARVVEIGDFAAPLPGGDGLQPGPNDTNGVEFLVPVERPDHT